MLPPCMLIPNRVHLLQMAVPAKCDEVQSGHLQCLMSWVEGCRCGTSLGLCRGQAAWFLLAGANPTPKLLLLHPQSSLLYQSPAASAPHTDSYNT